MNVSLSSCDATELIQAVSQANAAGPGPHQITLQAGCTYTLNHADNYWYGPNGLPPISSDITIVGNGATIERSSNAINFRFFYVAGPPTPTAAVGGAWGLDRGRLVLMDLTLRGGLAKGGNGGAVGGGGMGAGGALFLQGDVTLLRVTISGCRAEGGRADSTRPDQFGGGGMGGDGGFIGGGGFRGAGGDNGGDFLGLGEGGTDLAGGAGQGTQSATTSDGAGLGQLGGNAISNNEGARGGDGGAGANAGGGAGFGGAGFGDDAPGGGGFGGGGGSHNFIGSGPNGGGGGGVGGGGGYGGGGGFGGGGGGGGGNRTNGGQGGFGGGSGGSSGSAVLSLYGGGSGGSGNPTLITSKGGGGGMGAGGAIFVHQGSLTAVNSTLAENTAQGGNGGTNQGEQGAAQGGAGSGRGGAIFNLNGTVRLLHTTVARNTVAAGTPGAAQTAGVDSPGPANIASGGAVYNLAFGRDPIAGTLLNAALILQNSVLADSNGGLDLISEMAFSQSPVSSATVDASAPNIIESQSTIFSGASPGTGIQGVDPKLGGLADNGGLTHTLAAPADSPVADAADRILCADPLVQNRDQRNLFRPNCGCSLGAFEAKAAIHQQGEACGANSECSTCFCVDGVCCNNACSGSDPSSCQACSIAAGAPQDGTCQPRLAEQVCRPSADRYDPAEVCDGTSITCPPNVDNVVLSHKGGGGLSTGCTCTALPGVTTSPPSTFIVASLLLAALALALRPLRRIGRRRD